MKRGATVGIVVGVTRASAFVLGSLALGATSFLQVVGYVLVLVGLPEILLVRGFRHDGSVWTIAGALVVFVGSFLWVYLVSRGVAAMGRRRVGE